MDGEDNATDRHQFIINEAFQPNDDDSEEDAAISFGETSESVNIEMLESDLAVVYLDISDDDETLVEMVEIINGATAINYPIDADVGVEPADDAMEDEVPPPISSDALGDD